MDMTVFVPYNGGIFEDNRTICAKVRFCNALTRNEHYTSSGRAAARHDLH